MPQPVKILVLSLTRMGDILQSIPFFRRLPLKHPAAQIHVLVEDCFRDVAEFLPGVDRVHSVRLEDLLPALSGGNAGDLAAASAFYAAFVRALKSEHFTEVWNLTHNRPSMVLNHLLAGTSGQGVTLHDDGLQRVNSPWLTYFFATNLARPWCPVNLVDIYANCIDGIDWRTGRDIRLGSVPQPRTGDMRRERRFRVAIHPGASQKAKQWPVESFRETARRLADRGNVELVLVGGRADTRAAQAFSGIPLVNLIGKTSVSELAALLSECDLLLSNDSGPMHIAAAVNTRVIDLTIGSALASETAPYGAGHIVIEPDSTCFPCSATTVCPAQACARRITPQAVVSIALWQLGLQETVVPEDTANCRVYRTRFSASDGLLELERLFASVLDPRDELNSLARIAWLRTLSAVDFSRPESLVVCADTIRGPVRAAIPLAAHAERLARRLGEHILSGQSPAIIHHDAAELSEVERNLRAALNSHGLLQSFLYYVDIARGSLKTSTAHEQAAETAGIYGMLSALLRTFDKKTEQSNLNPASEWIHANSLQ